MVLEKMNIHIQKNEVKPLHCLTNMQLKLDKSSKCKNLMWNSKKKNRRKSLWIWINVFRYDTNYKQQKEKIGKSDFIKT